MSRQRRSRIAPVFGGLVLMASLAPAPRAADEAGVLESLAKAKVEVARKIADFFADPRLAALEGKPETRGIPGSEQVEIWTRRVVDARLDASSGRDDRIAVLLEDFERTKAIEARIKALADDAPGFGKLDSFKAEYYRIDAEYRLTKEKSGR